MLFLLFVFTVCCVVRFYGGYRFCCFFLARKENQLCICTCIGEECIRNWIYSMFSSWDSILSWKSSTTLIILVLNQIKYSPKKIWQLVRLRLFDQILNWTPTFYEHEINDTLNKLGGLEIWSLVKIEKFSSFYGYWSSSLITFRYSIM